MLIRPPRIRSLSLSLSLFVVVLLAACGGGSSSGGDGSTTLTSGVAAAVMPDWNDENASYQARSLDTASAPRDIIERHGSSDAETFTSKSSIDDTHDETEGDPLWTAYNMYRRLDGIRPSAADLWFERAQNLAGFFKTDYVDGSAWSGDASFNHDHLYGWGLCDWAVGEADADAISTIDQIVSRMDAFFGPGGPFEYEPGDSKGVGTFGRRWSRQARFAICAAEVSPTAENISHRDKMIDVLVEFPTWDDALKAYWLPSGPTDKRLGNGSYSNGDRITITFHMGIWMDALWHAWLATGREDVAKRIVAMAEFYRDFPLDSESFLHLNLGYNINDPNVAIRDGGRGSPDGVYTISPINGLVAAYKLTGNQSFLDRAWKLWGVWQETESGAPNTIDRYVDSEIASATGFQYLANNKGELQYVYQLFENGGEPEPIAWALARPSWLSNAENKTWVAVGDNGFMDVDPQVDSAWTYRANPGWDFENDGMPGGDFHTGVVDKWNGGVARFDYLVMAFNGGHAGSNQNTVFEFGPFTHESPQWWWHGNTEAGPGGSKYEPPSHTGTDVAGEQTIADWDNEIGNDPYSDGKPASRHTYDHIAYVPQLSGGGGMMVFAPFGASAFDPTGGNNTANSAAFVFNSEQDVGGTYVGNNTHPAWPGGNIGPGGGVEWDSSQKVVWASATAGPDNLYSYDPVTKEYVQHNSASPGLNNDTDGVALDPERRIFVIHSAGTGLIVWDIDTETEVVGQVGDFVEITGGYSGPLTNSGNIGFEYEPASKKFVGYDGGGTLYTLEPPPRYRNSNGRLNPNADWKWVEVENGAGGETPGAANSNGTYGRFRYIPSIHAFAVINQPDTPVYVYKLPPKGL